MKLRLIEGQFAVCRLPAASTPPAWVFDSELYSITKTAEELSIVCLQDLVPETTTGAQIQTDKGWSCLMVMGPLEFSMTGVLASLASPLAEAGVSIFAVSTYDTDYLFVKSQVLDQAITVLTASGHLVENNNDVVANTMNRPRDGPALSFESDLLVAILVEGKEKHPEPLFNLGVVTGWPPDDPRLKACYENFCKAIDQCWDSCDRVSGTHAPAVCIYPFTALHATAATLFRPGKLQIDLEQQSKLLRVWSAVVQRATECPEWPTEPLRLRIDSAQIGVRAGILLWKDETGGMEAIRECLRTACQAKSALFEQEGLTSDTIDIPPIIHSTFLRFYADPQTPGQAVQERFQMQVLPKLQEFFPDPFHIPIATLVCERTPYMHIPFDSNHVYASLFFTPLKADRCITDCGAAMERLQSLRNPL